MHVLSPVTGTSREMRQMPDPVFATGMVGPGLAIDPVQAPQTAVAPISGRLAKLYPHAFLVVSDVGPAVLVHLGIDTVHLHGEGFALVAAENDRVVAGEDIVTWDPSYVTGTGRSPMSAVVVLDCPSAARPSQPAGTLVRAAQPIFDIDC